MEFSGYRSFSFKTLIVPGSSPGLPVSEALQIRELSTLKAGKVPGQTGRSESPYNTKSGSARGDTKFRIRGAKMWLWWART